MKRILTIVIAFVMILSCCPGKHISKNTTENIKPEMYTSIERMMTYTQLDSLCTMDNISSSPTDWEKMYFVTDDNNIVTEYMYISQKSDTLFIYTVVESGDSAFVTKRVQIGE